MYETLARPLAEGSIELGREVTNEECRMMCLKASREYQASKKARKSVKQKPGKKKGKKNRM